MQKIPANQQQLKALIWKFFQPIFKGYDKDKNGALDKNQLRLLLADGLGIDQKQITQDQLDYHFEKIDENSDGKITYQQYFEHFFSSRGNSVFNKYDSDKNRYLDREEFKKLLKETFSNLNIEITNDIVNWHFDSVDSDHDGRITYQEYITVIKRYC